MTGTKCSPAILKFPQLLSNCMTRDLCFFDDGRLIAAAHDIDGLRDFKCGVQLWNARSGVALASYEYDLQCIRRVAATSDAETILAIDRTGVFQLHYSAQTGWRLRLVNTTYISTPSALALSPDDEYLALAKEEGVEVFKRPVNGKWHGPDYLENRVDCIADHPIQVSVLAWSRDSQRMASASKDGTIVLLTMSPRVKKVLRIDSAIDEGAFSPDLSCIAISRKDDVVVRDVENGWVIFVCNGIQGKGPRTIRLLFSPDGKKLVTSHDDTVQVWNTPT
jgi:WD40 repeat protein